MKTNRNTSERLNAKTLDAGKEDEDIKEFHYGVDNCLTTCPLEGVHSSIGTYSNQ